MDRLATRLRLQGYEATVVANGNWPNVARRLAFLKNRLRDREPVILIGHSSGGADAVEMAHALGRQGVKTDLLVVLDTVLAPKVPPSVREVYNLYLGEGLPHGIQLGAEKGFRGRLANVDLQRRLGWRRSLGIHHFNIDDQRVVHEAVSSRIEGLGEQTVSATRTIR